MQTGGKDFDAKRYLDGLQKKSEVAKQNLQFEKERLMQRILKEWNQYSSIFFWQQAFRCVPFEIMQQTHENVLALERSGYPVKTRAGLFVNTLKKMGYFPFKKEKTDGEEGSGGTDGTVPREEEPGDRD